MPKGPTKTAISKALKSVRNSVGKSFDGDDRSAVSRLMMAVLIQGAGITAARRAISIIEENFVDWNDVRITDTRSLIVALTDADYKSPSRVVERMQRVLKDIFEQHYVVNFEFRSLDVELLSIKPVIEGEAPDVPAIRDEGLPKHAEIPGFLDGERLLRETSRLETKLLEAKNSDAIVMSVYDNPLHVTAHVVWAVARSFSLVEEGLEVVDAITQLRQTMGEDQLEFARLALAYYEGNSRKVERFLSDLVEPEDEDEDELPFSVQIGFADASSVSETTEPIMPRSEGIGRLSKRAEPKLGKAPSTRSSGRGKKATSKSSSSGSVRKKKTKKTRKKTKKS